jgi:hypothetical protein
MSIGGAGIFRLDSTYDGKTINIDEIDYNAQKYSNMYRGNKSTTVSGNTC